MARVPLLVALLAGAVLLLPATPASAAYLGFQTADGNVGCGLVTGEFSEARCDVVKRSWSPPPRPASCKAEMGDWGFGMSISGAGSRGRYVCASDTAAGAGPKLKPGAKRRLGGFTCTIRKASVRCQNRRGHGFVVGRDVHRRF